MAFQLYMEGTGARCSDIGEKKEKAMTKDKYISSELFKHYGIRLGSELPTCKSDDDLYLVSCDYHGRYEDDDCYFIYLNAKTGKTEHNTWTTRGACPNFKTYLRMTVYAAVEAGYISREMYEEYTNRCWYNYMVNTAERLSNSVHDMIEAYHNATEEWGVKVTVNRGRKYRGEGVIVGTKQVGGWKWEKPHTAYKVLGTDNRIYTIETYYVAIPCSEVREEMMKVVNAGCEDTKDLIACIPHTEVDLKDAVDVDEEKAKAKQEALKAEKIPQLIEWCKNRAPEKSEEEIVAWAEKIFNRTYGA